MRTLLRAQILVILLVTALGGCSDDIQQRQTDVAPDTQTGDVTQQDVSEDTTEDTITTQGLAPGSYSACNSTSDCSVGECISNVCVGDPTATSYIAVEANSGVVEFPDIDPELGCYAVAGAFDPNDGVTPAPQDQLVTVWGDIERFGPGPSTFDVCVTFYDHERLLEFFDNSPCNKLGVTQERVDCFRSDPCRCDAMTGTEQTTCYKTIGLCDKLTGPDKTACEASLPDGKPLIYGYGLSGCEDGQGNPMGCRDAGVQHLFRIAGIPVNRDLVVKASGLELRWVDTFEYGALLPWNKVSHGTADPITGDTDTFKFQANVIAVGAWDSIPITAGLPYPIDRLDRGAVAGRLQDCGLEGRSAADPTIPALDASQPMVHSTVGFAVPPTKLAYFNGNPNDSLPDPGRIDANLLGIYAALNIPWGKNRLAVRVELDQDQAGADCVSDGGHFLCNGPSRNFFTIPHSVTIITFDGLYKEAN